MGLQCSILGHSFEPAGVEREREEQGSEVVTTEREIERCSRCGTERVVSESTEVTAVVDGEAVGLETEADTETDTEETGEDDPAGGGMAGAIDRSSVDSAADDDAASESPSSGTNDPETPSSFSEDEGLDDEPPDPEAEDAEILTDDGPEPERAPGQWPDDPDLAEEADSADESGDVLESEPTDEPLEEESLSGITVPEGEIVCPECTFRIEAHSGYREGDSCPECNAWLEAERNQ